MKLLNIIQHATEFGTFRSRKNFFSFTLKCIFYIIPAVILGNYSELYIQTIKKKKLLGDYAINYILLQTLIIISTLYIILIYLTSYTNEFQMTIAGSLFSILYFGIQPNYIYMIKDLITG